MKAENNKLSSPCQVFSGWANVNKLRAFIQNHCLPIDDDGDKLSFYLSANGVIYYRRDRDKARNIVSVLRNMGTTEKMRSELEELGTPFQYPKPKELLQYLIQIGSESNDIVFDFFAGSGTTAHAMIAQNVADGGNRRYILVQLPEPLNSDNKKQKTAIDFCDQLGKPHNIAELTKERLRRAAKKIKEENPTFSGDLGFRVFKLDSSNIRTWDPDNANLEQMLLDHIDHIKGERSEQDVLYELLLKYGIDLCVPIKSRTIAAKTVYSIGVGVLLVCLDKKISQDVVEPLALGIAAWHKELDPASETRVIFRDSAFADDVAKTNLSAILQQNGLKNIRSL